MLDVWGTCFLSLPRARVSPQRGQLLASTWVPPSNAAPRSPPARTGHGLATFVLTVFWFLTQVSAHHGSMVAPVVRVRTDVLFFLMTGPVLLVWERVIFSLPGFPRSLLGHVHAGLCSSVLLTAPASVPRARRAALQMLFKPGSIPSLFTLRFFCLF